MTVGVKKIAFIFTCFQFLRNKSYKYYNIEQQHEHAHSYARASPPTSTDKAIS